MRRGFPGILTLFFLMLLVGVIISLPPVWARVSDAAETLRIRARNLLFPQNEVIFQPMRTVVIPPSSTPPEHTLTPSPSVVPSATTVSITLPPLPTATHTPTPLPAYVNLSGVRYETQNGKWNYCAPTNLSMLLSFWGWKGDRFVTGAYLKPWEYDLNVMPYEMVDFIESQAGLGGLVRSGGSQALLKKLIAAGFPVLVERSVYFTETTTGVQSWMGHYQVFTGYDETNQAFIAQDSYQKANLLVPYQGFESAWRAFNYTFILAYTPQEQARLTSLLGDYADAQQADQMAYQTASEEALNLAGIDRYYAWYNRGSSQVRLQDYLGAAASYDQAFLIYPTIPEAQRPWRNIWYQTGPYFAYYYAGRYQDVLNLANTTLEYIQKRSERLGIAHLVQVGPYIEETWFWRARAKAALGDSTGAAADLRTALKYHPGFQPALDELKRLGESP